MDNLYLIYRVRHSTNLQNQTIAALALQLPKWIAIRHSNDKSNQTISQKMKIMANSERKYLPQLHLQQEFGWHILRFELWRQFAWHRQKMLPVPHEMSGVVWRSLRSSQWYSKLQPAIIYFVTTASITEKLHALTAVLRRKRIHVTAIIFRLIDGASVRYFKVAPNIATEIPVRDGQRSVASVALRHTV